MLHFGGDWQAFCWFSSSGNHSPPRVNRVQGSLKVKQGEMGVIDNKAAIFSDALAGLGATVFRNTLVPFITSTDIGHKITFSIFLEEGSFLNKRHMRMQNWVIRLPCDVRAIYELYRLFSLISGDKTTQKTTQPKFQIFGRFLSKKWATRKLQTETHPRPHRKQRSWYQMLGVYSQR